MNIFIPVMILLLNIFISDEHAPVEILFLSTFLASCEVTLFFSEVTLKKGKSFNI